MDPDADESKEKQWGTDEDPFAPEPEAPADKKRADGTW